MKIIYAIIILLLLSPACQRGILINEQNINRIENNLKQGVWVTVDDSTKMITFEKYQNDCLNGICCIYYPNGNIAAKGTYHDGAKNGYWRNYDINGSLVGKRKFRKGKLINTTMFNPIRRRP